METFFVDASSLKKPDQDCAVQQQSSLKIRHLYRKQTLFSLNLHF